MASDGKAAISAEVQARLWDAPTRIVHWSLVVLIVFAWWSAEVDKMEWHLWAGYGVMALIVFRLIWGFVGSASARFTNFVKGARATLTYIKTLPIRTTTDMAGHNPLGAWSVLAILAAVIAQVVTGLFSVDIDGIESGPLSDRVSFETGRLFAQWHLWSFWAIEVLAVVHLTAVGFYLVYKRSNLITPMITGRKTFVRDPALSFAPLWRAILTAVLTGAVTWWTMRDFKL